MNVPKYLKGKVEQINSWLGIKEMVGLLNIIWSSNYRLMEISYLEYFSMAFKKIYILWMKKISL